MPADASCVDVVGAHAGAAMHAPGASDNAALSLLISLLAFAAFLTPFVFRNADDNRLTSWQWLFADASVARFPPLVLCGIALAYVLRRMAWPPRHAAARLFASSFAAALPFWSEPEVIVDAARYFMQAKYLELHGVGAFIGAWGGDLGAWTDLPLIPMLYGLIFRVAGEERIYIQAFTTLLFAASVVLTFRIGEELWDEALGFTGSVLMLAMPYLLTQVPLMLVDVPAMFFVTLALFTTIRAFKTADARWSAAAAAAIVAAVLAKYSAALFLTALIPIFAVYRSESRVQTLRKATLVLAPALLAALALWWAKHNAASAQWHLLWDYQRPGLGRWHESLASTLGFQIHPFIAAAAAYSLYAAVRRRDLKYAIVGWMLALAALGGIGRIRYLIAAFPMLALAAAYGLREFRDGEARRFVALCAAIGSLIVAGSAYLPFLRSSSAANLERAGAYLDGIDAGRVEVIALEQPSAGLHPAVSVPLLDLFTHKALANRGDLVEVMRPHDAATSALRFTWEIALPHDYDAQAHDDRRPPAVAVILADSSQPLPPRVAQRLAHYCAAREFMASERVFGYQTLVRIYTPMARAGQPCSKRGAR